MVLQGVNSMMSMLDLLWLMPVAVGFLFQAFDAIKGNTNHAGSNDPNNPYFQGGSGNLFAEEIAKGARNLSRMQGRSAALKFDNIVMPGADGYMPYQREGLNVFAKNLFGNASGDWASRGFVTPQSMNAVVGSALTQAAPNLFSIQNQNQMLPRQIAGMITDTRMAPFQLMGQGGQFSRGAGTGYNNLNTASSNYWDMMNKIGSSWGSMGTAGGGKSAVGNSGIGSGISGAKGWFQ